MAIVPNRIVLISRGRHDEGKLSADAYPGMLGQLDSSGNPQPHTVAGGGGPFIVFKEDAFQGLDITQKLKNGFVAPFHRFAKGDEVLMLLQNGQNVGMEVGLMSAGDGTLIAAPAQSGSLYQITAASTGITNTPTETVFSNGSYTIPANFLQVGDVLHIRGKAIVSSQNGANTHDVKVEIGPAGATLLYDAGALNLAATQYVIFDMYITVRSLGATGKIVGEGTGENNAQGTVSEVPFNLPATTLDTTSAELIRVTSTANATSNSNIIALQEFQIDLLRQASVVIPVISAEAINNSAGTGTSGFNSAAFIRCWVA